jgi:hypothetical protein
VFSLSSVRTPVLIAARVFGYLSRCLPHLNLTACFHKLAALNKWNRAEVITQIWYRFKRDMNKYSLAILI